MSDATQTTTDRAERERLAYDENGVWEASNRWHTRFKHVFHTPNTLRSEKYFESGVRDSARGKRCLEIGCSSGVTASRLIEEGAGYVFGVDISEKFLQEAKRKEIRGQMEFALADVQKAIEGRFDLIFGRAILHHLDYREVLARLYRDNLNPGGSMYFIEPLGSNLLMRIYYRVALGAHTPDEKPFFRADLRWLRKNLPGFEFLPVNYLSLPAGILSCLLFPRPDNVLTRLADRADEWIARNLSFLAPNYRAAVFVFRKAAQ